MIENELWLVQRCYEKLGRGFGGAYREVRNGAVVGGVHPTAVFVLAYSVVVMLVAVLDRGHWHPAGRGRVTADYYRFGFLEDRIVAHLVLERCEVVRLVVVA